jgi:hypothetical protein
MILTACDEGYLSEAEILIKSCANYEPTQQFYLFLVGTDASLEWLVRTWHPRIILERVAWPYGTEPRPGMLYCIRSIALRNALETYQEPAVYLDSDTLLRGDLSGLFEDLASCDVMVKYRPHLEHTGAAGTPYGSTFNSGVIAIRPSSVGIRFAQEYDRLLDEFIASGRPLTVYREDIRIRFVIDQELLYVAYANMRDELLFKPLPDEFQYIREKLRYTNRLLFYPFSIYVALRNQLRSLRHRFLR